MILMSIVYFNPLSNVNIRFFHEQKSSEKKMLSKFILMEKISLLLEGMMKPLHYLKGT